MSHDDVEAEPAHVARGTLSTVREASGAVALVVGFVFLVSVAAVAIGEFFDRVDHDPAAEAIEVERWDCVESFVRAATTGADRLRLEVVPADPYVWQRVVESVYPVVDLVESDHTGTLQVTVRPGDDAGATCRGLLLSVDRP